MAIHLLKSTNELHIDITQTHPVCVCVCVGGEGHTSVNKKGGEAGLGDGEEGTSGLHLSPLFPEFLCLWSFLSGSLSSTLLGTYFLPHLPLPLILCPAPPSLFSFSGSQSPPVSGSLLTPSQGL